MRRTFGIFLLVGAFATGLQYLVLVAAVSLWALPATLASSLGFIVSLLCNYALNRRLTFHSRRRHAEVFPRFLAVSLGGLLLNAITLSLSMNSLGLPLLAAQLWSTAVVLVWNFLAHEFWTFSGKPPTAWRTKQAPPNTLS